MRRLQHLLTEATSQKSNLHPSQGEKECAACLLMIKHYLKDTCNDCWLAHTCLCAVTITNVSRHLCEEVTSLEVGWIMLLEHSCLLLSLARGSFWYKYPLCTFDCENFSPHPPSPSFHPCFIHFTRTHMIPLYLEQVSYERRNHLRLFRLGLTRVLPIFFVVWMGHLNSIPNCHSRTYTL